MLRFADSVFGLTDCYKGIERINFNYGIFNSKLKYHN